MLLPASSPAQQPSPPAGITVAVVEGEGGVNNIRRKPMQNLVMQVEDENRRPVSGVAVALTLPAQGASGTFSDGSKTAQITTDNQGRAVARFTPNNIAGKFEIHVNASIAGRTAKTTITQFNMDVRREGGGGGKIAAVVVLVGAAATAGAVVALRKQNRSGPTAASSPISLTPGAGTVTSPQ
jgi:hypothetical protein